ncbi:MAG TPA: MFS transporter [Longimicrobiales bacterium]|nr:MFS transporter [Longimicrobiales bacterium]
MAANRSPSRELLRGNVLWLSVVSFLNDAASEMIYPLLPAFILQLGAGPAFLGLIEGVAEATASLVKLASGWISDRVGKRKALAVWGYTIATLARPFIAVARAAWQVLIIRFADRVGKGVRTAPRDALLAESVVPARRGAAFGIHRAADHAGAVVGPLLASALLLLLPGRLRLVFALAALPGLVAVALLAWRVRESPALAAGAKPGSTPEPRAAPPADRRAAPAAKAGIRDLGGTFRRYMAVVVLFTLGNASDAFLLLRAQQLGVAMALIPILWAAFHVSKMVWSVVGGNLADRVGPRRAIVGGWLAYAATYAAFAFAAEAWQAWALFLFYGLYFGLTEAPEKLLVVRLAPAEARGTAFGAYHFAVGIAALPASLLFGEIWQHLGPEAAFLTGAGLALVAALALPLLVRNEGAAGPG